MTKPYKLLKVEWLDSHMPSSGWKPMDNMDTPVDMPIVTVGFLISQTKTMIRLAASVGDFGTENEQVTGIISIPKCCILRKKEIT